MQLPDNVQNILAYGQGYNDGMKDGHICGFHDALVCAIHDLTALLKKYHEMEMEYAGLQEKARKERLENMPQIKQPAAQNHGRWVCDHNGIVVCTVCRYPRQIGAKDFCGKCGARMDAGDDQESGGENV